MAINPRPARPQLIQHGLVLRRARTHPCIEYTARWSAQRIRGTPGQLPLHDAADSLPVPSFPPAPDSEAVQLACNLVRVHADEINTGKAQLSRHAKSAVLTRRDRYVILSSRMVLADAVEGSVWWAVNQDDCLFSLRPGLALSRLERTVEATTRKVSRVVGEELCPVLW